LKLAKLLLANVVVLAGLLLATNAVSAIVMAVDPPAPKAKKVDYSAVKLPNYKDKGLARQILQDQSDIPVRYVPFLEWQRQPYKSKTTNVNRQGDRVVPQSRAHAADASIVRFLGGSAMWGSMVDDRGTIPALFARLDPAAQVFDHGETGHNTRQNLARLSNLIDSGERLGTVVFYEGANDVASLCRTDTDIDGQGQEARMSQILESARKQTDTGPDLGRALSTVFVGRTLDLVRRITGIHSGGDGDGGETRYDCASNPRKARRVAGAALQDWRLARRLVQASGGRFLMALQPVAYIGHPRVDRLKKPLGKQRELDPELRAVYPYWRRAARREPWLLDLTQVFNGRRYFYVDWVHATPNGNLLVAERIRNALAAARGGRVGGP
jgi:hypothetical protein